MRALMGDLQEAERGQGERGPGPQAAVSEVLAEVVGALGTGRPPAWVPPSPTVAVRGLSWTG